MSYERIAFFVLENERNDKEEFEALLAIEGKEGYVKTGWYWGRNFDMAEAVAHARNDKLGIPIAEAFEIIWSTREKRQGGKAIWKPVQRS